MISIFLVSFLPSLCFVPESDIKDVLEWKLQSMWLSSYLSFFPNVRLKKLGKLKKLLSCDGFNDIPKGPGANFWQFDAELLWAIWSPNCEHFQTLSPPVCNNQMQPSAHAPPFNHPQISLFLFFSSTKCPGTCQQPFSLYGMPGILRQDMWKKIQSKRLVRTKTHIPVDHDKDRLGFNLLTED